MEEYNLSVRELEEKDVPLLADYWFTATAEHLNTMGADINKLPNRSDFEIAVKQQIELPYTEKKSYALLWELNGNAIGHCNVNPLVYGNDAYMHLHLWNTTSRHKGLGTALVKMSIPYFSNNLKLEKLYSQPYAKNDAPNRTLEKVGFIFVKEYITIPGTLNFEQPVKLWELNFKK
ncbi:MAG: GNAT family N-acetyltransferase [Flavobacterium sp. MedPE-SWcel]|uniref:GNAT family N-acetyltransferase n=1 Tax=uncultured Flavobacterium sp. TaxID=165435 RepID=UPI000916BEFC|nr:GNAT family N-acetyltransferase [uncultured Flavobacterium sp.]OIQ16598.1 MAG: GNAT family N-acetyltransferase [Flavobacterium sp. MedPE-SWcel]